MRRTRKKSNVSTFKSKIRTRIKIKNPSKINKRVLMEVIRNHCTADDIKTTISNFDFEKHHRTFKFPTVKCTPKNSSKIISKHFNRKRYAIESKNEFKRTTANHLASKMIDTTRNVLCNYPYFKYFERQGIEHPNIRHLCKVLVSKHLADTIASRRASWVNIFFYNFHKIGDFSNNILNKCTLTKNEEDKIEALIGIKCHQRGTEPFFPSTSFVSGMQYDYSISKDKSKKNTNIEDISVKANKDNNAGFFELKKTKADTKLYQCTDDCIKATEEECKSFQTLLNILGKATKKTIRTILNKYDNCSNTSFDDLYLLPREKRNHPIICYEGGCQSSSVLLRKLSIHYKNCRKLSEFLITLNTAHQIIHDIDVATVLGDIEYLIKLVALPANKSPSVLSPDDFPITEKKSYADHIGTFYKRCEDLPEIICQSCDMLVLKTEISHPKDNWKSVMDKENTVYDNFKEMLGIQSFKKEKIPLCNYCKINYNKNLIPPRSKLNNMDPGDVPNEIAVLTPLELMFISTVKVFQTVVKLGAVGKHVPHNTRLSALKGNAIHIPLPLEQTIKQLEEETDFTKIPANYIITHHIKNDELLLRSLINLENVHKALLWLKENNNFYKDINIPSKPSLFSDQLSEQSDIHADSNDQNFTEGVLSKDAGREVINSKNQNEETIHDGHDKPNVPDTDETAEFNDIESFHENMVEASEDDGENNPTKMIEKISSMQAQGLIEQYSVATIEVEGKSIMDFDNFYKFIKVDAEPLSHKEKDIDLRAFPNIFPFGKAGQNSFRKDLQPKMYEKSKLMSGRFDSRRNIPYLFYLLHGSERRSINQGVYLAMKNVKCLDGKNVGQLKKMLQNDAKEIERNLNRVVSKIPNSPSYWNAPRSMLKCLSETHGPATFFITFSPAEYDWPPLHEYLNRHNKDLGISDPRVLLTMDPVLTTTYIHQKFNSLHSFILESSCLGQVEHFFYRIEYQSRGTPHFHCMYWIKNAPIIGQSSDEAVMEFINEHITCKFPSKSENLELHDLVNNYLNHRCGNYCLRTISTTTGYKKACRFGFPRKVTSKFILYDVIKAILGRISSGFNKRLYHLPRREEEIRINDYNPILLALWIGNMDIQFIGDATYSLVQYITKYLTKADKSHLSNDDFGLDSSTISKLWQFALRSLKGREIGAYEACDRWFLSDLYQCSEKFQFVSTVFPQNRTRFMKSYTDLEKADPKSKDIFNKDLLTTYYPERPIDFEKMSLKDYAANYERAYLPKKKR